MTELEMYKRQVRYLCNELDRVDRENQVMREILKKPQPENLQKLAELAAEATVVALAGHLMERFGPKEKAS